MHAVTSALVEGGSFTHHKACYVLTVHKCNMHAVHVHHKSTDSLTYDTACYGHGKKDLKRQGVEPTHHLQSKHHWFNFLMANGAGDYSEAWHAHEKEPKCLQQWHNDTPGLVHRASSTGSLL